MTATKKETPMTHDAQTLGHAQDYAATGTASMEAEVDRLTAALEEADDTIADLTAVVASRTPAFVADFPSDEERETTENASRRGAGAKVAVQLGGVLHVITIQDAAALRSRLSKLEALARVSA